MGRLKGKTKYTSNFEPLITGPIDARLTITGGRPAIVEDDTWTAMDGGMYLYNGMLTTVYDSPDDEDNGIFILQNVNAYKEGISWLHVPTTTYVDTAIGNASVNLSPYAKIDWVNSTFATKTSLANYYTKSEVDTKISTVYKFKGSVANLTALIAIPSAQVGDAYNVASAFTLLGKPYPAGTNVVCIEPFTGNGASVNAEAKWDALGGTIDLSVYQLKSPFTNKKIVYDGGLNIVQNVESVFLDLKLVNADSGETTSKALTIPKASTTMPGLMPSSDKSKLDRISSVITSVDDVTCTVNSVRLDFNGIIPSSGLVPANLQLSIPIARWGSGTPPIFLSGVFGQGVHMFNIYDSSDKDGTLVEFKALQEMSLSGGLILEEIRLNNIVQGISINVDKDYIRTTELTGLSIVNLLSIITSADTILSGMGKLQGTCTKLAAMHNDLNASNTNSKFGVRGLNAITGDAISTVYLSTYNGAGTLSFGPAFYKTLTSNTVSIDFKPGGTNLTGIAFPSYSQLSDVTAADNILAAIGKLLALNNSSHWGFAGKMYLSTATPSDSSLTSSTIYTKYSSGDTLLLDYNNFIVKKTYFANNKSYNYEIAIDTVDCGTY